MKKILFLFIIAVLMWIYVHFLGTKTWPPGVLVKNDPEQVMLEKPMDAIPKGDFILRPLARYTISARVLHTKHYWSGDIAAIAPYDVAVGWGSMSDQTIIDQLGISQGNRFYFYEWRNAPPIPKEEITAHSSNMHLIPSTASIKVHIAWLRQGELIKLTGLLVEATNPRLAGMRPWSSSLSRTDTGNGACEIMWVESLEKL
jgi:hypothetical protein